MIAAGWELHIGWSNPCAVHLQSRRGRAVTFQDPAVPQPAFALDVLRYMSRHAVCRSIILDSSKSDLREVADVLKNITVSSLGEDIRNTVIYFYWQFVHSLHLCF